MAKKRLHPKSSAALISLTIHLVFILVAISFVAITVIQKEDSGVIHKRNSGLSIICIYNPSF